MMYEAKVREAFPDVFQDPDMVGRSEYRALVELAGTVYMSAKDAGLTDDEARKHLTVSLRETANLAEDLAENLEKRGSES